MRSAPWCLLAATTLGCAGGDRGESPDARPTPDSAMRDAGAGGDAGAGYRHTIALDGSDDFTADETFPTTSPSFGARLAWDDANLYVGYAGPDLSPGIADAGTTWLFVYVDVVAGGSATSETYNTQGATFPSGFAGDGYLRYKVDGSLTSLERFQAGSWVTAAQLPAVAQAGTFVELSVPLSALGVTGTTFGLVTWMINEKQLAEGAFAGLYADNFSDGYAANLALARFVEIDLGSPRAPNDPAARRP